MVGGQPCKPAPRSGVVKRKVGRPAAEPAAGSGDKPTRSRVRNPKIRVRDSLPEVRLGHLGDLIAFRLRYASGVAHQCFADRFAPPGYTPKQYSTVHLIASNPGINLKTLASTLGVDPSTLIETIDKLEQIGWIERKRSLEDRRVVGLTVTGAGRRELKRNEERMDACNDFLISSLTKEELKALARALDKIVKAATQHRP